MCIRLQVYCAQLSEQLSSLARICIRFSGFLSNVEDLRVDATRQSGWTDSDGQWPELIKSFTGVKFFRVAGNLSEDILSSLERISYWQRKTALPAMSNL